MAVKISKTYALTNRGKHFGNAWSVYSYKTKKHYKLTSDVEFAHWLLFLEFDQKVRDFELYPPARLLIHPRPHKVQLNAEVSLSDGSLEWHKIIPLDHQETDTVVLDLKKLAQDQGVKLRVFSLEQIVPLKYKIMPLLRVLACLTGGKYLTAPYNLSQDVSAYVRTNIKGSLGGFLEHFSGHDPSVLHYFFAKLYAEGVISVELNPYFFAADTGWTLQ